MGVRGDGDLKKQNHLVSFNLKWEAKGTVGRLLPPAARRAAGPRESAIPRRGTPPDVTSAPPPAARRHGHRHPRAPCPPAHRASALRRRDPCIQAAAQAAKLGTKLGGQPEVAGEAEYQSRSPVRASGPSARIQSNPSIKM